MIKNRSAVRNGDFETSWSMVLFAQRDQTYHALVSDLSETSNMIGCHRETMKPEKKENIWVVYHLQKKSGNFGWNVNGKTNLVFPNGKFPGKTGFLER